MNDQIFIAGKWARCGRPFQGSPKSCPRRSANHAAVDKDVMTVRMEDPYRTLRICTQSDVPVMDLWIVYMPQDREQQCCRPFGFLLIKPPKILDLLQATWPLLVLLTECLSRKNCDVIETNQAVQEAKEGVWNQNVYLLNGNCVRTGRD